MERLHGDDDQGNTVTEVPRTARGSTETTTIAMQQPVKKEKLQTKTVSL